MNSVCKKVETIEQTLKSELAGVEEQIEKLAQEKQKLQEKKEKNRKLAEKLLRPKAIIERRKSKQKNTLGAHKAKGLEEDLMEIERELEKK